ncbi:MULTISPECIES: BrnT family toxin [unclassified Polynucleobacter]|uniref:BrnT family toxin n=1 Tax=unclassified Polynucleobacter TaxID=2640945 RepID=UPI0008B279A2|nr:MULTISPECIES: BrnT family toxin [unclassified Polynucleobacter]OHC08960.1 MAG: hypothetical protein A2X74_07205 [Polynucleobacter sp. GWA2_45_21]HBK43523.1 hypothetical protein [Polynucleobacter sp.]
MINFQKIVGFQWDAGNAYKNHDKHGVSQGEAEEIFFNQPLLIEDDEQHSHREARFLALGITNAMRLLSIIFTLRSQETLIRIVSARSMSKKERAFYEKA